MPATTKNESVTDEQIVSELRAAMANKETISTSGTQKKYAIGYGRAKRLVDSVLAPGAVVVPFGAIHVAASQPTEIVNAELVGAEVVLPPTTAIVPLKAKMGDGVGIADLSEEHVSAMKKKHAEYKEKQSKDGAKALAEVEKLIAANSTLESQLEHSYVKLGQLLLIVSQGEFYRSIEVEDEDTGEMVPCRSMGRYLEALAAKYNKGKRMLQYYLSTVKTLMPGVSADNLNTMGIQKARKLADITRQTDILPDATTVQQVIAAPTVDAVAQLLFDKYKLTKVEAPKGTWYPMEGFYVEDNDRALLDEAFKKAARILKFSEAVPEWMRRRESLKLMAAEFLNVPEKSQE